MRNLKSYCLGNWKKSNVFDELDGVNIVNENYYTLGIILDGLPFINCAGLHFDKEKLSEIELFDNEKRCVKAKADDVFDAHQILLGSFFGTPCHNRLSEKCGMWIRNIGGGSNE